MHTLFWFWRTSFSQEKREVYERPAPERKPEAIPSTEEYDAEEFQLASAAKARVSDANRALKRAESLNLSRLSPFDYTAAVIARNLHPDLRKNLADLCEPLFLVGSAGYNRLPLDVQGALASVDATVRSMLHQNGVKEKTVNKAVPRSPAQTLAWINKVFEFAESNTAVRSGGITKTRPPSSPFFKGRAGSSQRESSVIGKNKDMEQKKVDKKRELSKRLEKAKEPGPKSKKLDPSEKSKKASGSLDNKRKQVLNRFRKEQADTKEKVDEYESWKEKRAENAEEKTMREFVEGIEREVNKRLEDLMQEDAKKNYTPQEYYRKWNEIYTYYNHSTAPRDDYIIGCKITVAGDSWTLNTRGCVDAFTRSLSRLAEKVIHTLPDDILSRETVDVDKDWKFSLFRVQSDEEFYFNKNLTPERSLNHKGVHLTRRADGRIGVEIDSRWWELNGKSGVIGVDADSVEIVHWPGERGVKLMKDGKLVGKLLYVFHDGVPGLIHEDANGKRLATWKVCGPEWSKEAKEKMKKESMDRLIKLVGKDRRKPKAKEELNSPEKEKPKPPEESEKEKVEKAGRKMVSDALVLLTKKYEGLKFEQSGDEYGITYLPIHVWAQFLVHDYNGLYKPEFSISVSHERLLKNPTDSQQIADAMARHLKLDSVFEMRNTTRKTVELLSRQYADTGYGFSAPEYGPLTECTVKISKFNLNTLGSESEYLMFIATKNGTNGGLTLQAEISGTSEKKRVSATSAEELSRAIASALALDQVRREFPPQYSEAVAKRALSHLGYFYDGLEFRFAQTGKEVSIIDPQGRQFKFEVDIGTSAGVSKMESYDDFLKRITTASGLAQAQEIKDRNERQEYMKENIRLVLWDLGKTYGKEGRNFARGGPFLFKESFDFPNGRTFIRVTTEDGQEIGEVCVVSLDEEHRVSVKGTETVLPKKDYRYMSGIDRVAIAKAIAQLMRLPEKQVAVQQRIDACMKKRDDALKLYEDETFGDKLRQAANGWVDEKLVADLQAAKTLLWKSNDIAKLPALSENLQSLMRQLSSALERKEETDHVTELPQGLKLPIGHGVPFKVHRNRYMKVISSGGIITHLESGRGVSLLGQESIRIIRDKQSDEVKFEAHVGTVPRTYTIIVGDKKGTIEVVKS